MNTTITQGDYPTKSKTWKPTLGSFSKAAEGAFSINFGESGGANCSAKCEALKAGVCYAVQVERIKPSVKIKGLRLEELGFYKTCLAYRVEIEKRVAKGLAFPWVRLSTFGSVPNRPLKAFEVASFVEMIRAIPKGTPIHFPVESAQKAERFRAIAVAYDLPFVVRYSCQSDSTAKKEHKAGRAASRIVFQGKTKRDRLKTAQKLARKLLNASVCPAIASTILKRPKSIKCGDCTLCAQPGKLILYPQH